MQKLVGFGEVRTQICFGRTWMSVLRLVIVRRGHFATFELLSRTFSDNPHVQVMWDRRVGERRQAQRPAGDADRERRQGDRRSPSTAWGPMNYTSATTQR